MAKKTKAVSIKVRVVKKTKSNFLNNYFQPVISLSAALVLVLQLVAPTMAGKPASADLDQCANGGVGVPPVQCAGSAWQNGNLNHNQAHYIEGQFVPYRVEMNDLASGSHILRIEYDVTKSDKHAIDYLGSFDTTETNADPVTDILPAENPAIPDDILAVPSASLDGFSDPLLNTFTGTQIPGSFAIWNADFDGTSYVYQNQNSSSEYKTAIDISFTPHLTSAPVVLAWGGHIASRLEWGVGNSAGDISGSPYHMRLLSVDGGQLGNQDRSLSAGAVAPPNPATLNVVKNLINDDQGAAIESDFLIHVEDSQSSDVEGSPATGSATGVSYSLSAGNYTVREETNQGYTTTYSGDCAADGTITLVGGDNKTCIVTNDDIFVPPTTGTLTVNKVVVKDNGGTAQVSDFTLKVGQTTVTSGASNSFPAGDYAVSETGPTGYAAIFSDDCDADGNITIVAGQDYVCTITNDDLPASLTVVKHVSNDDQTGSNVASDFTMTVTGTNVSNPSFVGAESPGVTVTLDAGPYLVDEVDSLGYTKILGTNCTGTIANGEQLTCTITNDDVPPEFGFLTVLKQVINDNGGAGLVEDFSLFVDAISVSSGQQLILAPGTHAVSEGAHVGYTQSFSGNCDQNGNVSVVIGQSYECNIINDDIQPKLTVTKIVSGGEAQISNFQLFVDQTQVVSGVENGFDVGEYVVSEQGPEGYVATFSGDCDEQGNIALAVGDIKTCTITNTGITPTLKITKNISPHDSSTFNVFVDGENWNTKWNNSPLGDGGVLGPKPIGVGTYTITEEAVPPAQLSDYVLTFGADCPGGVVNLNYGDAKTCALYNTLYIPPPPPPPPTYDLAVVKSVDNQTPEPGNEITYTITATNNSSVSVANVFVDDILPSSVTFVEATTTTGTYDEVSGVWTIGTLAVSETATLIIKATVNSGTEGQSIINEATVDSNDEIFTDSNPDNNTASTTSNVPALPPPPPPPPGGGGGGVYIPPSAPPIVQGTTTPETATTTPPGEVLGESIEKPGKVLAETGFNLNEFMLLVLVLSGLLLARSGARKRAI